MIEMKVEMVGPGTANIQSTATGDMDTLLKEMAVGCSDVIVHVAGKQPEVDALAQSMAVMMHSYLLSILAERMPVAGNGVPDA